MSGTVRAERAAAMLMSAYSTYCAQFAEITARARQRFECRDWRGTQADAAERLALYKRCIEELVGELNDALGPNAADRTAWTRIRSLYAGLIEARPDPELAETFFNSAARRVLGSIGTDPDTEFLGFPASGPLERTGPNVFDTYRGADSAREVLWHILCGCGWRAPYADLEGDATLAAAAMETRLREAG